MYIQGENNEKASQRRDRLVFFLSHRPITTICMITTALPLIQSSAREHTEKFYNATYQFTVDLINLGHVQYLLERSGYVFFCRSDLCLGKLRASAFDRGKTSDKIKRAPPVTRVIMSPIQINLVEDIFT